jgi:two-component system, OmpR family, response regulator ChvI
MGQPDACRGPSSIGVLHRMPATSALSQGDRSFNRRKSDSTSSSRLVAPAANSEVSRVVLVESDQYYRETLTGELLRQDFVVHAFADGASLLGSLATAAAADLAVLDWDLPRMSGIRVMAELRRQDINLPVVLLTGKVIAGDKKEQCLLAPREALDAYECTAFDQGAVDFIPKSRDREVLVRRLRRAVELAKPKAILPAREEDLACGKLLLRLQTSRASWSGVDVGITLGEYNIVHLLASNAGRYVTYRAIYDRLHYEGFVAGEGADGYRANVRTAIKRIRNKFRSFDASFDEIENYTGFGYCWKKPG